MKRIVGTLAFLTLLALLGLWGGVTGRAEEKDGEKGGYVHVVIFKMKKDTPATAMEEIVADCHKMLAKIKTVRSVKAGRPAEKATPKFARKDYDLALLVLVDDFDGLNAYLEDPLHVEFVKKYEKHFDMEKLQVFDFANQKK